MNRLNPRKRMLAGFVLANLAIIAVAAWLLLNRSSQPPIIQGVLLPEARAVPEFSLLDHHGADFGKPELMGRWHLVSYGFTTCPDICPTTLATLSDFVDMLDPGERRELGILFYTVDHRRDTVRQMASYVTYFDPEFVGLTHLDDPANRHMPFEQGLGITASLQPLEDPGASAYQVLHGVNLLLLNPRGELQAIFKPEELSPGVKGFVATRLYSDYRAVRDYLRG